MQKCVRIIKRTRKYDDEIHTNPGRIDEPGSSGPRCLYLRVCCMSFGPSGCLIFNIKTSASRSGNAWWSRALRIHIVVIDDAKWEIGGPSRAHIIIYAHSVMDSILFGRGSKWSSRHVNDINIFYIHSFLAFNAQINIRSHTDRARQFIARKR